MYQIVPGAPGEQHMIDRDHGSPRKKKFGQDSRPMVLAGLLGGALVLVAVIAWFYYLLSLRKAHLLKAESLDLKKDGYIIRNHAGDAVFTMAFR